MKALVTGATGFVGGNLVRELLKGGFQVKALVREPSNRKNIDGLDVEIAVGDLCDRASLDRAMDGCKVLFHVAASYAFWTPDPAAVYETNVQGTENVLAAAGDAGLRKIVYTSTESTIGIVDHGLGTEEVQSSLDSLAGHYKKSKLLAERLVQKMSLQGLPVTIVNPTMPVGPWDIKPTPTGQVVVDFLNGRMPAYVNTGLNVVGVVDVATGHILALEKGRIGERYILGNKNLTLRDILGVLETITGIRAPNVRIPIWLALGAAYADECVRGKILKRPPRIPISAVKTARKFRHFDCSKSIQQLGFPQTPIEESLRQAVSWFRQNGYVRQ
ncbi:NAD-dependent epimerase/dehydratase family protein [Candidatus Bipolaricaulota bacterium]|nr:NAD-dependent epimerase/dehydratase family protein [Candidatus Bipolaricaulota bacterium]